MVSFQFSEKPDSREEDRLLQRKTEHPPLVSACACRCTHPCTLTCRIHTHTAQRPTKPTHWRITSGSRHSAIAPSECLTCHQSLSCAFNCGPKQLYTPLSTLQEWAWHAHSAGRRHLPFALIPFHHLTSSWETPNGSPVGLVLSRWAGCRCWMLDGSWLGMWMVVAGDDGS